MQYKISFNDFDIIFKDVCAEEAQKFSSLLAIYETEPSLQELIFNSITDNKYDINELNAGIIPVVISLSLLKAGYFQSQEDFPNKIIEIRESFNQNNFFAIYKIISQIFPSYTLDQLKEKTVNQLIELVCFAEVVTGKEIYNVKHMIASINNNKDKDKPKATGVTAVSQSEIELLKKALIAQEMNFNV